jgi:HSP20 family protein
MNDLENKGMTTVSDLRKSIDRLFEDFWRAPPFGSMMEWPWQPGLDFKEEPDHYLFTLEVPGIHKDQLKIESVENQITISGKKHSYKKPKLASDSTEEHWTQFQKKIRLPAHSDVEKIEVHYQDGLLHLYVPKTTQSQPRTIPLQEESQTKHFLKKLLGMEE